MKIEPFEGGSFARNNPKSLAASRATIRVRYLGKDPKNLSAVPGTIKTGDEFMLSEEMYASLMHNDPEPYERVEAKAVQPPAGGQTPSGTVPKGGMTVPSTKTVGATEAK